MTDRQDRAPMTEERLVRALTVLAEIVNEHGPAYQPLYESIEEQLANIRHRDEKATKSAPAARAKRVRKVA